MAVCRFGRAQTTQWELTSRAVCAKSARGADNCPSCPMALSVRFRLGWQRPVRNKRQRRRLAVCLSTTRLSFWACRGERSTTGSARVVFAPFGRGAAHNVFSWSRWRSCCARSVAGRRPKASQVKPLTLEVEPLAGDAEGSGGVLHFAVMVAHRGLDHLALDARERGQ